MFGTYQLTSNRFMPKKPYSVLFTPDEKTILCGDKSGDVYSLPVIVSTHKINETGRGSREEPKITSKPFVPAASPQTVHTQRNLEALRMQQRLTNQVAKKKTLQFTHRLLLGHVSLLTDLACVTLYDRTSPEISKRTYIITSDRDEHIRVSRSIPQTHIIEAYCLGHSEFVSKLCVPPWNCKLLISGGGDDFLLIWDWLSGKARQKVDLRDPVDSFKQSVAPPNSNSNAKRVSPHIDELPPEGGDRENRIAVSGLWALRNSHATSEGAGDLIIVNCEGSVYIMLRTSFAS